MSQPVRACLVLSVWWLAAPELFSQAQPGDDRPTLHKPLKPVSRQELDHLEALQLYGAGLLQERGNRLLEAIHTFQEALRLDPDAAPLHRALVPLYLAVDRSDDALAECRKVLDLTPDDFDTGYLYARQLRGLDRPKEAVAVLTRVAAVPALKEQSELCLQVHCDLGVLHEEAGDWVRAEAAFRETANLLEQPGLAELGTYTPEEIAGQAADTYERLGRICLKAGHADRAVTAFEQARKKDPVRAARLALNLAEVHLDQGQPRQALERINDYLRTEPQGMEGYELKIQILKRLKRAADVVPELAAAQARDPHNKSLKALLAREYRAAGMAREAEQVYNGLLKESPGPDVFRGLFDLYKADKAGGPDKALTLLDGTVAAAAGKDDKPGDAAAAANARAMLQVLREDKDLVAALLPVAHRRLQKGDRPAPQTCFLLANLAGRVGQLDAAEELFRSCLGGGNGLVESDVYAGLLRVLRLERKSEEIVKVCELGLKKAEVANRALFDFDLALAHAALNHEKEALAAADEAVRDAAPEDRLRCRLLRAELLSQARRYPAAIAECQALLKEYNQPGDVRDVRATLSAIYSAAGEPDKSEEQLQGILKADPEDATTCNDLGYQWADRNKNLEEAERLIRKALDLDRKQRRGAGADGGGDNAAYVDSLGWVLFRRGDLKGACRELERASQLPTGSDDPVVWDHLGDVYRGLGQRSKAAEVWKKALALYDSGHRRKTDERYAEIKQKLRLLEP
jgi:tetratricopeptide (TPR) repeat protein